MLNNAGKKLDLWSQILLFAGIAVSVIVGILMIIRGVRLDPLRVSVYQTGVLYRTGVLGGNRIIISGFLVMILGSLGSWLVALLVKAFGELSVDTSAIRDRLDETFFETYEEAPVAEAPITASEETCRSCARDARRGIIV